MRQLTFIFLFLGGVGCADNTTAPTAATANSSGGEQAATTEPTEAAEPTAAVEPTEAVAAAPEPLPESLDAGTIGRGTLKAVLDEGIAAFLQKVSVQAHRPDGRFEGWLLQSVFNQQPQWQQSCVLRPGDLVLRVNNQSVERPEQFMAVWQSLASAGEIAIDVVRDGRGSRVRYLIVD